MAVPSNADRPEIEWTQSRGSREFPSTRFDAVANWTEGRDLALMAHAARNGEVVTTAELIACGFSADSIRAAVRRGLLTRWGRGVFVVGPLAGALTEARAAHAATRGVLGFEVAAQVARFGPAAEPPVDVIVPRNRRPRPPGVRVHRMDLSRRDVTRFAGLPATTPAVTLVHLARTMPALPYERAIQEAFARRLTDTRQLELALDRHRGGRGTRRLRRMLELGVDDLRSKAEQSLRRWLRAASLPSPVFNAQLGPWTVDAFWPEHRLAVEINGFAAHGSPWSHDRDHRKEQFLHAQGLSTRRFTALQAIDEPALVIAGIAVALAAQKR